MFHHGWLNVDTLDLTGFAQANGYNFIRHDLRANLPFKTGEADLLFLSHVLEHFEAPVGLSLLREMRRVINPRAGALRVIVPDAHFLMKCYAHDAPFDSCQDDQGTSLSEFGEVNEGVALAPTPAGKLYAMLHQGHLAIYDREFLYLAAQESGWEVAPQGHPGIHQIEREALTMTYGCSLVMDLIPRAG